MTIKGLHPLILDNGGVIFLPPNPSYVNLAIPSLHETSAVQLYDLTTKYYFNGKWFIYCRANTGGQLQTEQGAANQYTLTANGIAYTTLSYPVLAASTVAAAVGAESIYVVKSGAAKDDYKHGHVILGHNSDATAQNRGIVGNDVAATIAGVANVVKIDLDFPLQTALIAGTSGVEVMKCPYGSVAQGDGGTGPSASEYVGVVCVPCVYVATCALEYFWGQTWGPCWVSPGTAGFGASAKERGMVFDGYGSLDDELGEVGCSRQHAGFLLDKTSTPEDCSFIMLQISC